MGRVAARRRSPYPAAAYAFIADQQVVVLDGALTITQGGVAYDFGPGDCLRFGPLQDTEFNNPGTAPCLYLIAVLRAAEGPALA